jgi:folate-binding protein YgfZ
MTEHSFSSTYFAKLSGFAGFTVSGADANSFLQGQLTNDVNGLAQNAHHRTGYCTPKGRLMASFLQWRIDEHALGQIMPADTMEATVKRLRMFVLRAKAVFSTADQGFQVYGLWGSTFANLADGEGVCVKPAPPDAPSRGVWVLGESPCPVLGARAWLVGPQQADDSTRQTIQSMLLGKELPEDAWKYSEIQNAKAWVWAQTQEAFVPQMINFELTNGVSFTKGCYPGQEVVARSQYLGKLKRRTFRADCLTGLTPPVVGQDVFSGDLQEPCGQVVSVAPQFTASGDKTTGFALLVECSQEAWAAGNLRLSSASGASGAAGPELIQKTLPYEIPAAA